jgi:hypothetical protein
MITELLSNFDWDTVLYLFYFNVSAHSFGHFTCGVCVAGRALVKQLHKFIVEDDELLVTVTAALNPWLPFRGWSERAEKVKSTLQLNN